MIFPELASFFYKLRAFFRFDNTIHDDLVQSKDNLFKATANAKGEHQGIEQSG
jgi:hypothetical protein